MWPSCHVIGVGNWSLWNVAGALVGTLAPLLFLAALVGLAALAIFLVGRRPGPARNQPGSAAAPAASGRDLAQARYARGEITREQYSELLRELSAGKAGER